MNYFTLIYFGYYISKESTVPLRLFPIHQQRVGTKIPLTLTLSRKGRGTSLPF